MTGGLCFLEATELARLLRARELSAVEVMEAHLAQIERVNPRVNAIVTLVAEQALDDAKALDGGPPTGVLHGLPVAHKDLVDTAGIRTTYGSPIYRRWIPAESALLVERLQTAGAITVGKTNTPEFGAGSQTFNEVFGPTRNPYALERTCGGSSGGAAAALACGLVPIADGSDMGGSLRNPASFCNVVGLRPSPGRVPGWPTDDPPVHPLRGWPDGQDRGRRRPAAPGDRRARSALPSFPARAGLDLRRAARTRPRRPPGCLELRRRRPPVRSRRAACARAARLVFESLGCEVVDGFPDLSDAGEIFQTLRAVEFARTLGEEYDTERERLKETIRWNVELGRAATPAAARDAARRHAALQARVREFMADVDVLALPTVQVPPFPSRSSG